MVIARIRRGLLLAGLAGLPFAPAGADSGLGHVIPGSKAAGLSSCVRETPFMRRNHMELILHQRDLTVHRGIRGVPESLAGCVDCHAAYDEQGRPVSVEAEGQFCRNCHEMMAVDPNCFGCHSAVPMPPPGEAAAEQRAEPRWAALPAAFEFAGRLANQAIHDLGAEPGAYDDGKGE